MSVGEFLLFGGHIFVPVIILLDIFFRIINIKSCRGNPYLEISWKTYFIISLIIVLVVLPIWLFMIFMFSILVVALPHGRDIYLSTVLISGLVMISLYIIIIIICVVGMGKKDKIMRRNNKNKLLLQFYINILRGYR